MRPYLLRRLIPFALVVLLLPSCSDSADDVAATTVAQSETATTAASTTSTTLSPTAAIATVEALTGTVPAEVEEEIIALIDSWLAAWNDSDGQAGVDLFTDDGRFVSYRRTAPGYEALEGQSGEVLKDQIDRWSSIPAVRSGDPLIIMRDNSLLGRPDSYRVAQKFRDGEYGDEMFELYNIVDEDGTLKFRYIEFWSELGWYRLAEDQPYRGSGGGE